MKRCIWVEARDLDGLTIWLKLKEPVNLCAHGFSSKLFAYELWKGLVWVFGEVAFDLSLSDVSTV